MRRIVVTGLVLVATVAAITWWALESGGVAILQTDRPDGSVRSTRVWYAEHGRTIWIEAATDRREFLSDIRRHPDVTLAVDGRPAAYHAQILATTQARDRVRELLRAKYGCRDWWIGLLQDTSGSVVVELSSPGAPTS